VKNNKTEHRRRVLVTPLTTPSGILASLTYTRYAEVTDWNETIKNDLRLYMSLDRWDDTWLKFLRRKEKQAEEEIKNIIREVEDE